MNQLQFSSSQALTAALLSASLMPSWEPGQVFYESSTVRHLLFVDYSNGYFRTIRDGSGTSFEVIEVDNEAYARSFNQSDLEVMIGQYPQVTYTNGAFQEGVWTWEIICDGNSYFGENAEKIEAMAQAFLNILAQA